MKPLRLVKIYALICAFSIMLAVKLLFSQTTGSLVLQLDVFHNLFTLCSLVLMLISHKLSDSKGLKNTFGWVRIEVVGTLVNLIFFLAFLFSTVVSCLQTIAHAGHEDVVPVYPLSLVILGSTGVFMYIVLQLSVGGTTYYQKFLFVIRDFSSSIMVILSGLILIYGKDSVRDELDAFLCLLCVGLMGSTYFPKVKESGLILLQSIPKHIDCHILTKAFLNEFSDSVFSLHDLHIWSLTSDQLIASCHIKLRIHTESEYRKLSLKMGRFFEKEGIQLATIQPEFITDLKVSNSNSCIYKCSKESDCDKLKCCKSGDECVPSGVQPRHGHSHDV